MDQYLQGLVKEMDSWTLSQMLKISRIVQSEKVGNGKKTWCYALYLCADLPRLCGMTVKEFGKLVAKLGGKYSQDTLLLDESSEDDFIKRKVNGRNKKCLLVPHSGMSSETWCQLCTILDQEDLLKLADGETPSGCITTPGEDETPMESTKNEPTLGEHATPMQSTQNEPPTYTHLTTSMTGLSISAIQVDPALTDLPSSDHGTDNGPVNTSSQYCSPCERSFKSERGFKMHRNSKSCKGN